MRSPWLVLLVLSAMAAADCELVGDILEVGFWARRDHGPAGDRDGGVPGVQAERLTLPKRRGG
jgi:hypothetical protein